MTVESRKVLAVGEAKDFESICSSCTYRGCTTCPSIVTGRNEKVKDYPQIISATQGDLKIIVHACKLYLKRNPERVKVERPEFVWDSRQKKHVKVIK